MLAERRHLGGAASHAGRRSTERVVGHALHHKPLQGWGQFAQTVKLDLVASVERSRYDLIEHVGLVAQDLGQGEHVVLRRGMDPLQRRHELAADPVAGVGGGLVGLVVAPTQAPLATVGADLLAREAKQGANQGGVRTVSGSHPEQSPPAR